MTQPNNNDVKCKVCGTIHVAYNEAGGICPFFDTPKDPEEQKNNLNLKRELPKNPCKEFKLSPVNHPAFPNGYCITCGFDETCHQDKPQELCEFESDGQVHSCISGCDGLVENCRKCKRDRCSNPTCPLGKGKIPSQKSLDWEEEQWYQSLLERISAKDALMLKGFINYLLSQKTQEIKELVEGMDLNIDWQQRAIRHGKDYALGYEKALSDLKSELLK